MVIVAVLDNVLKPHPLGANKSNEFLGTSRSAANPCGYLVQKQLHAAAVRQNKSAVACKVVISVGYC